MGFKSLPPKDRERIAEAADALDGRLPFAQAAQATTEELEAYRDAQIEDQIASLTGKNLG
ncbi:MAG: hypothetical protein JO126_01410 [Alphaproteobacteria bacterium]|nr:hypothetical protein [Alphaproteobacteria bacterium]